MILRNSKSQQRTSKNHYTNILCFENSVEISFKSILKLDIWWVRREKKWCFFFSFLQIFFWRFSKGKSICRMLSFRKSICRPFAYLWEDDERQKMENEIKVKWRSKIKCISIFHQGDQLLTTYLLVNNNKNKNICVPLIITSCFILTWKITFSLIKMQEKDLN